MAGVRMMQDIHKTISTKDLEGYFSSFSRPPEKHRFGIECEVFGLCAETGRPIPYFGSHGIEGVLDALERDFGWARLEENTRVIALSREGDAITLEPGGQVELSAAPVRTLAEIEKQISVFHHELRTVGERIGVRWLSMGTQPLAAAGEMPWVPKARYEIMRHYLASHGSRSHDMMQRTATNQFNVDYSSEADGVERMRLVFRLTPFVTTAFAHSPIFEGRVSGYQSYRIHIWQGTDPDRTGIPDVFLGKAVSFSDYLDYVLGVPTFFIVRNGEWIPLDGMPFRTFIDEGFGAYRATFADFELHLSTVFPECRLKNHIEIRGIDAQTPEFNIAPFAFWKGILAAQETREAALAEVEEFSTIEFKSFYTDFPRQGIASKAGVRTVAEITEKLFQIALLGLSTFPDRDPLRETEASYLRPYFERYVKQGRTPADDIIAAWPKANENPWPMALKPYLI